MKLQPLTPNLSMIWENIMMRLQKEGQEIHLDLVFDLSIFSIVFVAFY